ncbi:MAG: Phosphoglycerate mutase [Solirubrobacterales bacterium]|nr:Phosphoglycerate mutase [Solirubrobacterales bacterium]
MSEETYPQRPFSVPADATEVVLVRHGASQAHVAGESFELIEGGHADPALAPEGEAQAARVGARLAAGPRPHAVFVTPLRRTHQTAAPLVAATGRTPVVIPELREVHLGDWEGGELRVRLAKGDPLAYTMLAEERWSVIPGAEEAEAFAARVRAGLGEVVARSGPGTSVVAVVHGGVIGEVCRQATGSRPFAFVHADNCSITRIVVFADGRLLLRSFNDTTHLA